MLGTSMATYIYGVLTLKLITKIATNNSNITTNVEHTKNKQLKKIVSIVVNETLDIHPIRLNN